MFHVVIVDYLFALCENCEEDYLEDLLWAFCMAKDHFSYVAYCIFEEIDCRVDSADDRVIVMEEKKVVFKNSDEVCIDSDILHVFFVLRIIIFSDLLNDILQELKEKVQRRHPA